MMRIRTRLRMVSLVLVGAFVAAACSSTGSGITSSTTPGTQGTVSTAGDAAAVIHEGEPLVEGFASVALLGPGSIGAGAYPLFRWEPVAAAGSVPGLLAFVDLHGFFDDRELDVCRCQDLGRVSTGVVAAARHDSRDAAGGNEHGTDSARFHRAIDRGSFERKAVAGGLNNGVLFGMHGADTVLAHRPVVIHNLLQVVARLIAVRHAGW